MAEQAERLRRSVLLLRQLRDHAQHGKVQEAAQFRQGADAGLQQVGYVCGPTPKPQPAARARRRMDIMRGRTGMTLVGAMVWAMTLP